MSRLTHLCRGRSAYRRPAAELKVIPFSTESHLDTSIEQILKLETEVWEALRTGDSRRDSHMLSDDFLGV